MLNTDWYLRINLWRHVCCSTASRCHL